MKKNAILVVKGISIAALKQGSEDYISLTDIARNKNEQEPKDVIKNRMRSRTTIEFLGTWEQLNNPGFRGVEFDAFLYEAGSNSFTLSPSKWIEATQAVGMISRQGNKGGTFAHKDIAFEFASWISAGFKLYLIKEFQRLNELFRKRTKDFAVSVLKFLSTVPYNTATKFMTYQLGKSATTVGANFRAFCRWRSKNEKFSKICIVVEEADECVYWIELFDETVMEKRTG